MVSVNNYVLRNRKDGTTFVALELVGGLEMIKSNTTGNYYATMKTRRRRRQLNLGITAAVIIYKKCLGAAQRTCTDVADEFTATTHPPNTA